MIEMMKKLASTFFLVIAGSTISSAIFITIFIPEAQLSVLLLWQIILMSFITALGNLIFYSKRELGKGQMKIRLLCHYVFINIVVFSTAILCEWMTVGVITEAIAMFCLIAVVYTSVLLMNIRKETVTAEELNRRLSRLNSREEE